MEICSDIVDKDTSFLDIEYETNFLKSNVDKYPVDKKELLKSTIRQTIEYQTSVSNDMRKVVKDFNDSLKLMKYSDESIKLRKELDNTLYRENMKNMYSIYSSIFNVYNNYLLNTYLYLYKDRDVVFENKFKLIDSIFVDSEKCESELFNKIFDENL